MRRKNSGVGDYIHAARRGLAESVGGLAAKAKAAADKEASRERKVTPEQALRTLAKTLGYEIVKKNPKRRNSSTDSARIEDAKRAVEVIRRIVKKHRGEGRTGIDHVITDIIIALQARITGGFPTKTDLKGADWAGYVVVPGFSAWRLSFRLDSGDVRVTFGSEVS